VKGSCEEGKASLMEGALGCLNRTLSPSRQMKTRSTGDEKALFQSIYIPCSQLIPTYRSFGRGLCCISVMIPLKLQ
jgi:hypothetical protein